MTGNQHARLELVQKCDAVHAQLLHLRARMTTAGKQALLCIVTPVLCSIALLGDDSKRCLTIQGDIEFSFAGTSGLTTNQGLFAMRMSESRKG